MFVICYFNGRGERVYYAGPDRFSYSEKDAVRFRSYDEANEGARRLNAEFDIETFINLVY